MNVVPRFLSPAPTSVTLAETAGVEVESGPTQAARRLKLASAMHVSALMAVSFTLIG